MLTHLIDIKEFLEAAAGELEEIFNSTCAFPKIHQVLLKCVGEMREDIQLMRGNAQLLCTSHRKTTTLQRATTAVKSEKSYDGFVTVFTYVYSVPNCQ